MARRKKDRGGFVSRLASLFRRAPQNREQLIAYLHEAQRANLLDLDALAMIEGALQVSELRARDIMIPRAQMVVVNRDDPLKDSLPAIIESAHSRFPVVGYGRGDIVGILLAKDLLEHAATGSDSTFNMREFLRSPIFVPESKRLDVLLRQFRASRNHMAIVVDEYGAVAGLVTIEDVLEQIVGEIEDEHDFDDDTRILKLRQNLFTIKALLPMEEFDQYFACHLDDEDFDTIGGYVTHRFGHVPERGESICIGRFCFEIIRADSRRVHLFRLRLDSDVPDASNEAA